MLCGLSMSCRIYRSADEENSIKKFTYSYNGGSAGKALTVLGHIGIFQDSPVPQTTAGAVFGNHPITASGGVPINITAFFYHGSLQSNHFVVLLLRISPEIVRLFIARIEIGERTVKYSRHSAQKIRIIYRDIGEWDYDDAAEAEQQQPQIVAVTVTKPELLPA